MPDYATMSLLEIAQEPGVKDLQPLITKAKFAQALKSEALGDHARAEQLLGEAAAKESK